MAVEQIHGHIGFLTADGDLSASQFCVAKAGAAMKAALATAKSDKMLGVIQNTPVSGGEVDLAISGVSKVKAGAAITAMDRLTVDTTGRAITADASAKDAVFGIALEAATAANQIITVLLVLAAGVGTGSYRIARGIHRQVAAADTVVTGLATVVAATVAFDDAPTVKQLFARATIGDQAGTPAAGSIIISTFKPTAVNDVTPVPATDFTDNIDTAWVAIGT